MTAVALITRRVVRAAAGVVMAAVVAAVALLAIGPRVGAFRAIVVLGPSMGRTLPLGSVVISTPEPASAIRVGQIVSFHSPVGDHQVETHRVVKVLSSGSHPVIWTKGDANATRDPWTARVDGSTVWRARTDIPYAGGMLRELRRPAVHDSLVIAVPAMWAGLNLWAIWAPAGRLRRYRPAHRPARTHRPRPVHRARPRTA